MTSERRNTAYFAKRRSTAIVREATGLPYKAISILVTVNLVILGIRDMFFCGKPFFPNDPVEQRFLALFEHCDEDPYSEGWSGIIGVSHMMHALLRARITAAQNTADLYFTMMQVVFTDLLYIFLIVRAGSETVPWVGYFPVALGTSYDFYILVVSRHAYLKRTKAKAAGDVKTS